MGDIAVKNNLNEFKQNCTNMENNTEILKSSTEQVQTARQTCAQIEQLRALSSNAKKILACHDSLDVQNKSYTAYCSQCKMSKKDHGCGIHSSDPEFLKLKEVQSNWIELHKCIRFIYKNAISSIPCVASNEKVPEHVNESLKELIEILYKEDHQQLFIRLEVLVRDFVLEAKNRLKDLQNNVDDIPVLYLRGLLASYGAFCTAAEHLALYIPQLDSLLLQRFSVNFELLNKYLFQTCLYADAYVQNNVPLYISQLRTTNSCSEFTNQELVHSYLALDDEMTDIASRWLDVKKLILKHSKKRDLTHYKQPLLFEDWEIYREYQELATNKIWRLRTIKRDLVEFDVQLLSLLDDITNHICELDLNTNKNRACNTCKNCNSDILCSCDDCTIKHILSCCMETPPASPVDNTQDNTYSFTTNMQTQQINMASKPCTNNNSDELESIRNKKCVLSSTYDISDALAQNALANAGIYSSSLFQSGRSPKGISKQGKDENNSLFVCNNKVNKIPMSKNFLKLITDKIITNSFVKNFEENNKAVVTQTDITPGATVSTGTESSVTTASSTNATSKVPASSIASISFSQPTPTPNSQGTNTPTVSVKQVQASKEPIQSTLNKPQCNQTYQDFNKKVKKESIASQVCKDGCTEGDPVKTTKESKRCDCPHCEVFESTNPQFAGKNNKTRDRLRIRLNEKRNKTLKEKDSSENTTKKSSKKESTDKVKVKCPDIQNPQNDNSETSVDTRDIRDLLNFIEGIDRNANLVNAQKKAAKKARRKEKKLEEERAKKAKLKEEAERLERERKLQEKQRQEELRLKAQTNENNKYRNQNTCKNKDDGNRAGKGNNNHSKSKVSSYLQPVVSDKKQNQTKTVGPMVTIKRVMECINSEPTVTITLKGSTPDKDKLLYTLVNGQTDIVSKTVDEIASTKTDLSKKQKKKKGKCEVQPEPVVVPLNKKERNNKKKQAKAKPNKPLTTVCTKPEGTIASAKKETVPETNKTVTQKPGTTLNLQMLRLPPGITITKVDGPAVNRKLSFSTTNTPAETVNTLPTTNPTDNRSGVIVVDTVKLKQVLPSFVPAVTAPVEKLASVTTKKKKKGKKNKNKTDNLEATETCCLQSSTPFSYKISSSTDQSVASDKDNTIVTIKNPMFYQLQDSLNKPKLTDYQKWPKTQQASIIKGKNGMVTIRSPRLGNTDVQSYNGHIEQTGPMHKISATSLSELKPVMGPHTPIFKPSMNIDNKKPFNAQEILSGLPGIEITKISKNSTRNKSECKMFQPADVSIIPTNIANGSNGDVYKLFYDNMDWSLESVFAPKDIKEDEVLDADELELEAFKRFCQQSVPPERKEKVAHLNVKDIVLKKKTSTNVC